MAQAILYVFVIALGLPKAVSALLIYCKAIVAGIKLDAAIAAVVQPPVAQLDAELEALDQAHEDAEKRGEGLIEARDAAERQVRASFKLVKACLETWCHSNPTLAAATIAKLHLRFQDYTRVPITGLTAFLGTLQGEILLRIPRPKGAFSVHWQYSTNGHDWTSAPDTVKASTRIAGLTSHTPFFFRHQLVTKDGTGDWSASVSITPA